MIPTACKKYGGSGKAFDWSLIDGITRPYFLAGGLNCSNIEEAMDKYKPFVVDVSSGVETEGFKDPEKIRKFIMKVEECKKMKKGRFGVHGGQYVPKISDDSN